MAQEQPTEVQFVGYVRRQAWEEMQQRQTARLYTGATVHNLPYFFTEPQPDGHEWLEVAVTVRVVRTVPMQGS